ncbi:MAG TPA: MarP family serine protease [Acidimicrobiales bacterium]|nr:MarP family serine protease [Acidimicrobiales bacterium]
MAATVGGYRAGFTTRVPSWIGLGVGLLAGLRAVHWMLDRADGARYELVIVATVAVVVVPAMIGETIGFVIGRRVAPQSVWAAQLDRGLGGAAGLIAVLATVWMILPVLGASRWSSELVSDSTVARLMTEHLPEPPDVEGALRSVVGDDTFPQVFEALPPPVTLPPPAHTELDAATIARVATSVVRIEGVACRVAKSGTGFIVDDALVVTNAHVVAGERTTSVRRDDGRRLSATVVALDPNRDLALLSVSGLGRAALPVGESSHRGSGGVFGHPEGGPLRIAPFAVARRVTALGRDIYGATAVQRDVLELAADLRHGDSGAALVNAQGEVVGVAFALSEDQAGVAYALATTELNAILRVPRDQLVDTGPCIN